MRFDRINLKRKPDQSSFPTAGEEHRGDLRVLSGDGSTTTDKLYFGRNRAGTLEFTQLVPADFPTLNDAILNNAVETSGTAPTIAATANAGSTASVSIAGNDTCGRITLTPGGVGIAAGNQLTVTFAAARPDTNYEVFLQPFNDGAAGLSAPVARPASLSTTTWALNRATTALTSGTTYIWSYLVIER